eukprot:15442465-Alexandrium_andersonii.AAC.1
MRAIRRTVPITQSRFNARTHACLHVCTCVHMRVCRRMREEMITQAKWCEREQVCKRASL